MLFELSHLISRKKITVTENEMPEWLKHKENKWFLDENVLTLEVGCSIKTDFWLIKRIE